MPGREGEARGLGDCASGAAMAFARGVLPPMRRMADRHRRGADGRHFLLTQPDFEVEGIVRWNSTADSTDFFDFSDKLIRHSRHD